MANGWFNVDADTRKNIHPFKQGSFSFRKGTKKIGILPRYDYENFKNDIGILDQKDQVDATIDVLLTKIPSIKIREYTQDLKITTLLNLVEYGVQGFKDAGEVVKGMTSSAAYARVIKDEFSKPETYKSIFGSGLVGGVNMEGPTGDDKDMLQITYNLYYHIMGHTSTNTYVLPFISKTLYETNGQDGWPNGPESGWGGTSSNSILGKIMNLVGSNYKIVTEPIWKPIANSNGMNIELTLHLFNDTLKKSAVNYVFVQNLTSNNMPLQYGIIQQPPSCYEINIDGGKRLFMCSGKFSVNNIGTIRMASDSLLKEIQKYTNFTSAINKDYIRIPDIYEVKLTFKSLLPDVFNDFMYQFTMQSYNTINLNKDSSVFTEFGGNIDGVVNKIKDKAKSAASAAEPKDTLKSADQGASS